MAISDLSSLLPFVQGSGYLIVFLAMVFEGPIIAAAAAFAASMGVLNVWAVFFLAFLGNFLPDIVLYSIGRFSRSSVAERRAKSFGLKGSKVAKIEQGFENHAKKTIVFVKVTPMLPVPGLILAGFMKVPFKQFFLTIFLFNLISAAIFVSAGFYFGLMTNSILRSLDSLQYIIIFLLILLVAIYFFVKKIHSRISKISN